MFGFIAAFLPWILYWILVGNASYLVAVSVAFGVAVVLEIVEYARTKRVGSLEVGSLVFFLLSFVSAFLVDDAIIEQWLQPLSNGALLLIALVGALAGHPFVRSAAAGTVDPATAKSDGFRYITTAMTWMWIVVFAIMTASSLIPPIVDGAATIRDAADTLSIVCYWIVPFVFFGIAGAISGAFPGWFDRATKRLDAANAAEPPAVTPAGAPPDLVTEGVSLDAPLFSLHSDHLPIRLAGLPAGEIELRASATDLLGRRWAGVARYAVPDGGALEVGRVAPIDGDWSGGGGRGVIGGLRFAQPGQTPDLFLPPVAPMPLTLEAAVPDGTVLARRTVSRAALAPGVRVLDVEVGGLPGLLALPADTSAAAPGVACFGGSEGGVDSMRLTASLLADAGYAALVMAWTDADAAGRPLIARIPLERFGAALDWLRARPEVDRGRVGALAISRGSEGLLAALAAGAADARAAVLLSPSRLRWQAVDEGGDLADTGSWTLGGEELPWAPIRTGELVPQLVRNGWRLRADEAHGVPALLRLRPAYEAGLRHAPEAAGIDATAVAAPLLLAAGADDALWPSAAMTADLAAARGRADDVSLVLPGAGHLLRLGSLPADALWTGGIAFGGSREGHAAAERELWPAVSAFLAARL